MNLLNNIEKLGNRLPDPATLFVIGTVGVFIVSMLAAQAGWTVTDPAGQQINAINMVSASGIWWLLSTMVDNFIAFPPLGIVLVGMLGIGLAEKTGFLPALINFVITHVSSRYLTPATMLMGILSSLALDAGYVVLVPIAAVLYSMAGRSPLLGIAVSFAGVSAGFSANFFITALDPLLAGFTQAGAQIIQRDYEVAVTSNWWFMITSTILLTITGWFVTERFVAPNVAKVQLKEDIAEHETTLSVTSTNKPLVAACSTSVVLLMLFIIATTLEGWPLFGTGKRFDRWIEVTVPLLFIFFFIPGLVYGLVAGTVKTDRDVANMLGDVMARLGPYIVLAFFAAQFIAAFNHSGLGKLLAIAGGNFLQSLAIGDAYLLSSFVIMVVLINLLVGSASAKYAFFAPVFVPMLMQVGISPELTQAAYRVGDSVSNVITPMNPYMIIIIMEVRKYVRGSGLGTVVATMLPYTIGFLIVWLLLLVAWIQIGVPLGPEGPLRYVYNS